MLPRLLQFWSEKTIIPLVVESDGPLRADYPTRESGMVSQQATSPVIRARHQATIRRRAGSKAARQPRVASQRVAGLVVYSGSIPHE